MKMPTQQIAAREFPRAAGLRAAAGTPVPREEPDSTATVALRGGGPGGTGLGHIRRERKQLELSLVPGVTHTPQRMYVAFPGRIVTPP